jgi:hypothetical protein
MFSSTERYDSLTDLPAYCERPAIARLLGISVKTLGRAELDGFIEPLKFNHSRVFYRRSDA